MGSNESASLVALLRACAKNKDLCTGSRLHNDVLRRGLLHKCSDALITMYSKCGAPTKAKELLDLHKSKNVFTWTALIAAYADQGLGHEALYYYEQMQHEGLSPVAVTFTCILKACGSIGAVDKGEEIHDQIAKERLLETDIVLGTALVNMYAKCGALEKARQVLEELPARNSISWNTLISGYAQHGEGLQALECFEDMQREGLYPNAVTFISLLKACGSIGDADKGKRLHGEIAKQGLLQTNVALCNAIVDMYVKCGALGKAREALEGLPTRNVVSWSALISGYAQQGEGEQALNCFEQMQNEGLCPNTVTYLCILKACAIVGAVDKGEKVHDEIAKQGLIRDDIVLGTALVDMYAKCGALEKAQEVLKELPVRDVISWNALISGYVQQGDAAQALICFQQMQRDGISPDATTLLSVLTACGRLGLVEDAQMYLMDMGTKYGLKPDLEHLTCIVDLFGRLGQLDKAVTVLKKLSVSKIGVWLALLSACLKWGDVNVGRWAFEHAVQANKTDAGVYVLMAKIYVAAGMQEDADNIEALRLENMQEDADNIEALRLENKAFKEPPG